MTTYLYVFLGAAALALLATPVAARIARALGLLDYPATRRIHRVPVPRIGGLAIFPAVLIPVAAAVLLDRGIGDAFAACPWQMLGLLAAAASMLALGAVDDARGLRATTKLLGQTIAALAACAVGIRIQQVAVGDGLVLDFGWLSWPITVLWIVGITNAINLIDGLDGLAAGISAIACACVAVIAIITGQPVMAALMLALLGGLAGFLVFNFNPARVFLGDSGTMFIGFVIATACVASTARTSSPAGLALPAMALGLPILDTLLAMLRRALERRSLLAPDCSHIHHRLLDMGLSHRSAVLLMYAVTLLAAVLGSTVLVVDGRDLIIICACVAMLHVMVFRMAGAIRVNDMLAAVRRIRHIRRLARKAGDDFHTADLEMRRPARFEAWWMAVCAAAEEMAIANLQLTLRDRSGGLQTLTWVSRRDQPPPGGVVRMNIPVRDRRSGPPLGAEIEVCVNGSLEMACRRAALFARLFEEHSLANLRPPERASVPTAGQGLALPVGSARARVFHL